MFTCEKCGTNFTRIDNLHRHQNSAACKRKSSDNGPPSKKCRNEEPSQSGSASTSNSTYCTYCKIFIPSNKMAAHMRTLVHRTNSSIVVSEGVKRVQSAFKNRISSYRFCSNNSYTDFKLFFNDVKNNILNILEEMVSAHKTIKVNMEIFASYCLEVQELTDIKSFNTPNKIIDNGTDLEEIFEEMVNNMIAQSMEFDEKDSDTEFIYKDEHGGVTLFDADNLTTTIVMTNYTFIQFKVEDFKISNDLRYILLINDVVRIYKYTTLAKYFIYEISSRLRKPLSPKELDDTAPYLQYATWSPDGTAIAFVYENDIYYKPKVEKDLVCRITNTGQHRTVFNGVPDWLYENQVLKTHRALWFSPDGLYLLFATFNDTNVGEYKYSWYDTHSSQQSLYPKIRSFRYPRVETANPEVTVWIVNLTRPKYLFPFELKPTNSVEPDSYLTSASFHGENNVAVVWLNRLQNTYVILTCRSANNFNCTNFHIEREHIGWTEPIFHPIFNENGTKAMVRLPVKDGDNGHFMHVCEIYNGKVRPLTHGMFELIRILAWDEEEQYIYAIGTIENTPGVRHLIRITDRGPMPEWMCMTCRPDADINSTYSDLSINETLINNFLWLDYPCEYNNVIFSKKLKYYVQECLGPEIPIVLLVKTSTNARRAILDTSYKLRRKVRKFSPPQMKSISVEIEFGFKAQVKLYLPGILREYEDTTFPIILLVDAAPSSQTVSSKWEISWSWYLASTRNYIVAQIDARGSGFQGVKLRREIQRRIGLIEVQDQLAVLTYLRDTFKFIDRSKICIHGKGYGGYVAAMMLLQDFHQVVNCSISISPITNWRYYNSYFTEKYLGFPSKHLQEYDNADLTKKAGNLKDRRFFLIHSTADTLVTPQHSLMLAKALINQDILFQQLEYPDEDHDFSQKTLIHMYREIDQFFNDSFGPVIEEWTEETSFFI